MFTDPEQIRVEVVPPFAQQIQSAGDALHTGNHNRELEYRAENHYDHSRLPHREDPEKQETQNQLLL